MAKRRSHIGLCLCAAVLIAGDSWAAGQLLFKSGFEQGVSLSSNLTSLRGRDSGGHDWGKLPRPPFKSHKFWHSTKGKRTDYVDSKILIRPGPHGKSTRVLALTVKRDDPKTKSWTRNELMLLFDRKQDGGREGYARFWMQLPKALETFGKKNPMQQLILLEWKEPDSGSDTGGSNNYRINIKVGRTGKQLHWRASGQQVQPKRTTEWNRNFSNAPLIYGKWFQVETYFKQDRKNGRVLMKINAKTVLDYKGRTQHKKNPLPLHFFSPLKNYPGGDTIKRYMKAHGPLTILYDDFEYWSSFPPEGAGPSVKLRPPATLELGQP